MFVLIEPLMVYAVLFNNKKGIDLENNVQISFQYYWIPGAHNVFVKKKNGRKVCNSVWANNFHTARVVTIHWMY